jgi:hypothetical protein
MSRFLIYPEPVDVPGYEGKEVREETKWMKEVWEVPPPVPASPALYWPESVVERCPETVRRVEVFNEEVARRLRVEAITEDSPEVEASGVELGEVKRRMLENMEYEPVEMEWCEGCSGKYAHLTFGERVQRFFAEVERWFWPRPLRLSSREMAAIAGATEMADSVKADYGGWVISHYRVFGPEKIRYNNLKSKHSCDIYKEWLENKLVPDNVGVAFLKRSNRKKKYD